MVLATEPPPSHFYQVRAHADAEGNKQAETAAELCAETDNDATKLDMSTALVTHRTSADSTPLTPTTTCKAVTHPTRDMRAPALRHVQQINSTVPRSLTGGRPDLTDLNKKLLTTSGTNTRTKRTERSNSCCAPDCMSPPRSWPRNSRNHS